MAVWRSVLRWTAAAGRGTALAAEADDHPGHFHTSHDTIPNFAMTPTITSAGSGAWSSPGTWSPSRVPIANDVALIQAGHTVTYDQVSDVGLAAVGVKGMLRFRTDVSTRLKVGTLLVTPTGALEIGTAASPVPPEITAERIIANRPLATTSPDPHTGIRDPKQYGTSLLVLGRITIAGAVKTPTWTRVASEPLAGHTMLALTQAVSGWRVGDRIVLPDTRQLPVDLPKRVDDFGFSSRTEALTMAAISADGRQITLSSPLQFAHQGPRNPDGTIVNAFTGEPILPHVGNISRNVVIRSEHPAGTRGHSMLLARAVVSIRYAEFRDLGRTTTEDLDSTTVDAGGNVPHIGTNQIGRYWTHSHHLWGPARSGMPQGMTPAEIRAWLDANGWQYEFIGNAVAASTGDEHKRKWGITVHDSHFGKVTDNVLYNVAGSGIQTEDASESYNLIARNFAARLPGEGHVRIPNPDENADTTSDIGKDGSGLWFRGPHNWVEGNVAADATFSGVSYSGYYITTTRHPLFPGADPSLPSEGVTLRLRPMLSSADNEAYGPMPEGLWAAWPAGCCNALHWPEMKVERFIGWHQYQHAVKWYHSGRTMLDRLILRGDPAVTRGAAFDGRALTAEGMDFADYENVDLTVRHADIRGFLVGIDMPRESQDDGEDAAPTVIAGGILQNYVNLKITPGHHGATKKESLMNTVHFEPFTRPSWNGYATPFNLVLGSADDGESSGAEEIVEVFRYDASPNDHFRVYYLGGSHPCAQTRPEIKGYVCPPTSLLPPPPHLRGDVDDSGAVTLDDLRHLWHMLTG